MIPASLDANGLKRLLAQDELRTCLAALRAEGEETRLVGGCVRDALLGRDVSDIDLATTLLPARTMELARAAGLKAVPTGFEHGTVTLVVAGAPFEVTTLREDIETDGRHAVVRFGRDFARDAERRDFTINALSLGADGQLHDSTGGVVDLAAGRVRFIGDPATRIREDGLRILRFFRFHARYGAGDPDPDGLAACIAARDALDRLSRERVRAEFLNLLLAPGAVPSVAVMSETGLLQRITGGVGDLGRLARAAAGGTGGTGAPGRLAALAVQSTQDADRLRERLRLSKAEHIHLAGYATALAALRNRCDVDVAAARGLAATFGAELLGEAMRSLGGEPRPRVAPDALEAVERMRQGAARPVFPVAGADLVARGVSPGPGLGAALAAARRVWLDEGCPSGEADRARLIALALAAAGHTKPADAL